MLNNHTCCSVRHSDQMQAATHPASVRAPAYTCAGNTVGTCPNMVCKIQHVLVAIAPTALSLSTTTFRIRVNRVHNPWLRLFARDCAFLDVHLAKLVGLLLSCRLCVVRVCMVELVLQYCMPCTFRHCMPTWSSALHALYLPSLHELNPVA